MDSCVRKKRSLAERRESDKLRQRRFRAKKREEARLMHAVSGPVEKEKKERIYSLPKKTADEIRATNRLRQQRFRAKRRGEFVDESMVPPVKEMKKEEEVQIKEEVQEDPVQMIQRVLLEVATDEKNRQTEIRREKDRIRKRRERQRKRDNALRLAGFTPEQIIKHQYQKKLAYLEKDREKMQSSSTSSIVDNEKEEEIEEDEEMEDGEVAGIMATQTEEEEEYFDTQQFMAQLEQMGLVLDVAAPPGSNGSPVLELKQKESSENPSENPSEDASEESTSSSPGTPIFNDLYPFLEKKPWQRCHSAEERRERERMRKRMYRAKQRFISTGKLEMQWDPTLIKRSPTDDDEEGITPLPPWNKSMSQEQKLEAHRIYNRRYRERLRKDTAVKEEESSTDLLNTDGDIINTILSTMSQQFDLSSILVNNQVSGESI